MTTAARRDPATRYNRLLDAAGVDPATQMRLDGVRTRIADRALAVVRQFGRGRALDIGAGALYFADEFRPHFASYTTLDYEVRSPRLQLRGDGQRLPFASSAFDTVISIDVLEHVPHPWEMWAEMSRVLAPGGTIIIVTPFFFWAHEEPYDFYRISKYGLQQLCAEQHLHLAHLQATCGFVATLGLLATVTITRLFHRQPAVLRLVLRASRAFQMHVLLPLDDRIDRSKRFAQGHVLAAQKPAPPAAPAAVGGIPV
jgi:SAM-dependent methyltransferase